MNGASHVHMEDDNSQDSDVSEGECETSEYSDDDEDEEEVFDRKAYGLHQQLPIKRGAPDYSAGPPQTAEEYLRRVRCD